MFSLYFTSEWSLTGIDLLRRPRQERRPRLHQSHHRHPIPHRPESDHRSLSSSLGLFARRRPPLLQLLPARQPTHPLPARQRRCRPDSCVDHLRSFVSDQLGSRQRAVLALRRQQLRGMGNSHRVPVDLGRGTLPAGRVLHGQDESADCCCCGGVVGVWTGVVHVS